MNPSNEVMLLEKGADVNINELFSSLVLRLRVRIGKFLTYTRASSQILYSKTLCFPMDVSPKDVIASSDMDSEIFTT